MIERLFLTRTSEPKHFFKDFESDLKDPPLYAQRISKYMVMEEGS